MELKPSTAMPLRAYGLVLRKLPLRAIVIAWWWVTRRRVRARNQFDEAVGQLGESYPIWLKRRRVAALADRRARPAVTVHVHAGPGQQAAAAATLKSVLRQLASSDVVYVTAVEPTSVVRDAASSPSCHALTDTFAGRGDALRHVLTIATTEHLMPLRAGTQLAEGALAALARASGERAGESAVLYGDQDEGAPRGRRGTPWFKPAWDPDLFLAQDYLSAACLLPVRAARLVEFDRALPDDVVVYALLLKIMAKGNATPAQHVPVVAVTTEPMAWLQSSDGRLQAVRAATGLPVSHGAFGTVIVHRAPPTPLPLVSVIVPTRDRLDLLETCVRGVLERTDYDNLEVVIVDNGSVEPETLAFFEACGRDPRVKVVRWPHAYNYSAINNFAASHATGEYLCLLNNDTEVIAADWLREMVAQAARPGVGAVGARLIYPDHSIQHAGVVVGMGNAAGHAHRGLVEGDPGYFAQALVTREATAVTAACLVVARGKFTAVGGLDEAELAIAYNDVDLCLKLRRAGWRTIYAAQAVLIHHESKSRGRDFAPEHLARYMRELAVFQKRWSTVGYRDPTHHPALDTSSETYRLKL